MTLRASLVPQSILLGIALVITSCALVPVSAQDSPSQAKGVPDDWSHHHVIFSNPGTLEDAVRNGSYAHWLQIQTDPRFKMQQMKRQAVQLPQSDQVEQEAGLARRSHGKLQKDWNVSLGVGGVAATMYPAKYSFSINGASCSDYVVFPADTPGVAAVAAHQTGTASGAQNHHGAIEGRRPPPASQRRQREHSPDRYAYGRDLNGTSLTTNATQGDILSGSPPHDGSVTITEGSDSLTSTAGTNQSTQRPRVPATTTAHSGTFAGAALTNTNATNLSGYAFWWHRPLTGCGSFVGVTSRSQALAHRHDNGHNLRRRAGIHPHLAGNRYDQHIIATVTANPTTSALVTAVTVGLASSLTANTWGTVGNGYTLPENTRDFRLHFLHRGD